MIYIGSLHVNLQIYSVSLILVLSIDKTYNSSQFCACLDNFRCRKSFPFKSLILYLLFLKHQTKSVYAYYIRYYQSFYVNRFTDRYLSILVGLIIYFLVCCCAIRWGWISKIGSDSKIFVLLRNWCIKKYLIEFLRFNLLLFVLQTWKLKPLNATRIRTVTLLTPISFVFN